jgi:hypothetical protein
LQQERSQQLLWRDRGSPRLGVQPVEPWLQFPQCLIGHDTKRAQGVIVRNSLLWADVAEYVQLLFVFSSHALFFNRFGCGNKVGFGYHGAPLMLEKGLVVMHNHAHVDASGTACARDEVSGEHLQVSALRHCTQRSPS